MVIKDPQYRERVSQLVSWGHWFILFNIIISLLIGSRYLFIIDWPNTLTGRIYSLVSWLGQFSFLGFSAYLLVLFPLTFLIPSQRLLRFIATVFVTAGLTLLLLDSEVFHHVRLHFNPLIWELLSSPDQGELARQWQLLFITVPVLFLLEMLLSTWCWQKLRSLQKRSFAKPIVVLFICSFIASHLMYIWADANFYRQITMQKSSLPLSYPMTARGFLEKYGLLDSTEYERRRQEQGDPAALSIQYPLAPLSFYNEGQHYNLLMVVVDQLDATIPTDEMPDLTQFARQNIMFTNHFSSGIESDTGLFGLFYGIAPYYMDGIIAGRKSSALVSALEQQDYQLGLFSTDGFSGPLYRHALFSDISLPAPEAESNPTVTSRWQQWLSARNPKQPWFAYVGYHAGSDKRELDQEISKLLTTLRERGALDDTVVIITAKHSVIASRGERKSKHPPKLSLSRQQLSVPLIVHWPGAVPYKIDKLTHHQDVMRTLMQRLLYVKTAPNDYSQGEDLFTAQRQQGWLLAGDEQQLMILTAHNTLILTDDGQYYIYDRAGRLEKRNKLPLALMLQALMEVKRFISD